MNNCGKMADATRDRFTLDALSFLDGLDFELSWFTILVGFLIAYWGYYYAIVVRKPQVRVNIEMNVNSVYARVCIC